MSDDKKKRGRPKKRTVEKRELKVRIGVTPLEYGLLKNAAKEQNTSVSELIRGYLDEFFGT